MKRQLDSSQRDSGENNTEVMLDSNGVLDIAHNRSYELGQSHVTNMTNVKLPEDGACNAAKRYHISHPNGINENIVNSVDITAGNEIVAKRDYHQTYPGGFVRKNTKVTLNDNNDITISIDYADPDFTGRMIDIRCGADGTVFIYGRNGVTIASDHDSISV